MLSAEGGKTREMRGRVAGLDDVPAIVRVVNRAYRVEEFFVSGNRTDEDEIRARMSRPNACFLVVEHPALPMAGALAGAVYVEVSGTRGYFGMLSIDPDCQRRGLGRELARDAEMWCRAKGCLVLDIDVVNLRLELPAFYSALGFSTRGTAPFPDAERLLRNAHMVLMSKPLA